MAADATDLPADVIAAARTDAANRPAASLPAWADRLIWTVLWKIVAVGLAVAAGLWAIGQLSHFLGLLGIALFFALAMIPGVEALTRRFGMRRGAAVGIIYLAALLVVVLLVVVLIPGIVRFAQEVSSAAAVWFEHLNTWWEGMFGSPLLDQGDATDETSALAKLVQQWASGALGAVSSGIGAVFNLMTIAMFAFYLAADWPRVMRAVMSRMPPERQRVFKWVATTSIEQTGGYFYSRLLLASVCGGLGFVAMLIVGLDLVYALPLAMFMGFVSTFIPFIGTYLGAALPILITLAVVGVANAIGLLVWVLIYQQLENYALSPKLSSKTMELNGAVAFGGAIAGGALAGPMGAFMALPIAALITAIIKNTGRTYAVIDEEVAADEEPVEEPDEPGALRRGLTRIGSLFRRPRD
ncbi:AI-2E family transporter [Demequina capsici]|uniref:AI-2E family transporter n=1 Tax=Demequina capsici TaxID=3075620 RepID=A0AA96FCS3_9MICO|nr:AI-2E family transporter [Demequina sp. PMTSA13]WNM27924.1 AI-2E family transporter [Demequina sp. PMTSA13]